MAAHTFKGNNTDGTANPTDVTAAALTAALSAATTSAQGALSAADKASVDLWSDWASTEAKAIRALIPQLTGYKHLPIGSVSPTETAPSAFSGSTVEGGGIAVISNTAYTWLSTAVFQAPKTGKWAVSFRGRLLGGGVAAHDSFFQISNAAGSHTWAIMRKQATSATKYTLSLTGTGNVSLAGSLSADSATHVFTMMFDGTTCTVRIDGTTDITQTTISQMADEPMYVCIYAEIAKEAVLEDAFIMFVPN